MSDKLELLQSINWFLRPVSDAILFLFSKPAGWSLLLLIFTAYVLVSVSNAIRVRRLLHAGNDSSLNNGISLNETITVIVNEVFKIIGKVVTNVPILLSVIVLLLLTVGMSSGLSSIDEYLSNQKRIKELQTVLKHLDARCKVADVEVEKVSGEKTTLNIKFYDPAEHKFAKKSQKITIRGTDIYFDALILNFEYSEIASGSRKNIVLPYRIFSDEVSMEDGTKFDLRDENGIPYIFHKKDAEIYGISSEKFNAHLKEIAEYIDDKEKARAAGVRSIYGNAVHRTVEQGDAFTIWIEQTGGLVIKDESQF